MRVLIHGIDFSPEEVGSGKYTGEMAQWLALRGHQVRVVTTAPHFPQWKTFEGYSSWRYSREVETREQGSTGSLTVTRCPAWIPRDPRGWKRILYLSSFALSSTPAMLLQVLWRPDIVLMVEPTMFCAPHVLFVAMATGSRSWLHVQDFEVDAAFHLGGVSSRLKRLVHAVERFLMSKFDRVSTISERMLQRLSEKGVETEKGLLTPNWVDTARIYPLAASSSTMRGELGISDRSIVALYSGSMGAKHGLKLLLDASRRLTSHPEIQFVFCGDGPYRETLLSEKGDNVIVLPLQPADRLNELLNMADIHLLPQLADAADLVMPSKLTGMMASGRPVVATAQAGTQLARALDGRGIIARPGDVDDFVSAITKLAENASVRNLMGQAARQYAVEHMDRGEVLTRFEISLRETCSHIKTPNENIASPNKERLPLS